MKLRLFHTHTHTEFCIAIQKNYVFRLLIWEKNALPEIAFNAFFNEQQQLPFYRDKEGTGASI